MDAYCQSREIKDSKSVRFHFDGTRIQEHHTAEELEMVDEDRIDVHLEQQGGGEYRAGIDEA